MNSDLKSSKRLLVEASLRPIQGDRFQPTGFADIGAGTYELPNGTKMLLVESAQSVANRFESSIMRPDGELLPELEGLPYIRVKLTGEADLTTSSLLEAHRINSPFIISDEGFKKAFVEAADYARGKPLDWRKIARAIFRVDPNSLLHGVFLANLEDGRIKIPRAVSGFIEAKNVREAVTGGVKNNHFDPSGKIRVETYDKDVYGNVPYQRIEYTAESITAYFNLDTGLLKSYELGDDAFELLANLAQLKIQRFLEGGLRLRTACDLELVGEIRVTHPVNGKLSTSSDLLNAVTSGIKKCQALFASPAITEIKAKVVTKVKPDSQEADAPADDEAVD
ncbi:MAG: type I-U CRISPR-associated RAMP protein Csb1/Cas7u [Candidatus Ozemobacteraceae bacterium]